MKARVFIDTSLMPYGSHDGSRESEQPKMHGLFEAVLLFANPPLRSYMQSVIILSLLLTFGPVPHASR